MTQKEVSMEPLEVSFQEKHQMEFGFSIDQGDVVAQLQVPSEGQESEMNEILNEFEALTKEEAEDAYFEHRDEGRVRLADGNMHKLKPGDVVELSYYSLWHLVVVECIRHQPNKPPGHIIIDSIHYGRPNLLTPNRVIRESFELNLMAQQCWLRVFPPSGCYKAETVLRRARSRLNEEQHSPLENNASQFAVWCKVVSSTHRPASFVPIFLSDRHETHQIKTGDHLNVKCDDDKSIHAEVTNVDTLGERQLLTVIVREDDLKETCIPIVHETQQRLTLEVPRVVSTSTSAASSTELNRRIQLLNKIAFKSQVSSLSFCHLMTHPNHTGEDWIDIIDQTLHKSHCSPFCKNTNPKELKVGHIIYINNSYRVVTGVHLDKEAGILVSTVQYTHVTDVGRNSQYEIRLLIDKKEKDTTLCVHNDPLLDCHLYGGGRDTPSYTVTKVTDIREIHRGCVISMRMSGFYQHAIVVKVCPGVGDNEEPGSTENSFDVITYVFDPGFSTELFEVRLRKVQIDVTKNEIHLVKYSVLDTSRYSEEEVIARALSRQGEREHNLMWNSGRDFARWCSIRHPSNREQCRVQITSIDQLLNFKQGHVKFHKTLGFYTHDAILRDCSRVEGFNDIVRVRLYENNHVFRTVRVQNLTFDDDEQIRRVCYEGCVLKELNDLDLLIGCTFLNAEDEKFGWTQLECMSGSKVTCQDFCYWLKVLRRCDGLQDIRMLFGSDLLAIQRNLKTLCKDQVLRHEDGSTVSIENDVKKSALRKFDHVILTRKVNGKDAEVHFILTEWDAESSSGVGVTFELPTDVAKMGFNEFNGFLQITGPGQVEKVVHNMPIDWEMVDAKFEDCKGIEKYDLLRNNCEHFVNFLIYGRFTSLQISDWALTVVDTAPSFSQQFAKGVGKFARLAGRLMRYLTDMSPSIPDGRTFWAEGISLALILGFSVLEVALLQMRRANTGMSNDEYKKRRRCILSTLCSTLMGLGIAVGLGINAILPLLGLTTAALIVPRVPAIVHAYCNP